MGIQIHELQLLSDRGLDLILGQRRVLAQRVGNVLVHRHGVEERSTLKHHPHAPSLGQRIVEAQSGPMSRPLTMTRPLSGTRRRRMSLSAVDFPVPDSPTMTTVSPR